MRGAPLTVGDIGLAATRTHARIPRRVAPLLVLLEAGTLGPPVSGSPTLLAAHAPGARFLLLFALAAVERLRQDASGRAQPLKLGLQRLDARGQRRGLRRQIPNLGTQPAIPLPQRRDQPRRPHDRRSEPIVTFTQPRDRALPGLHQPLGRCELPVELLAQRLGHTLALELPRHHVAPVGRVRRLGGAHQDPPQPPVGRCTRELHGRWPAVARAPARSTGSNPRDGPQGPYQTNCPEQAPERACLRTRGASVDDYEGAQVPDGSAGLAADGFPPPGVARLALPALVAKAPGGRRRRAPRRRPGRSRQSDPRPPRAPSYR